MTLPSRREPVGFSDKPSPVTALQASSQRHKVTTLYIIPQEQGVTELTTSKARFWPRIEYP
jgi:hypothetical protein